MNVLGVHHVSIEVDDLQAAKPFYLEAMGFTALPRPDFGFAGLWLSVGDGELHIVEVPRPIAEGGHHFAVHVADLDDAMATLRGHGVKVDDFPATAGAGRQAFLHDPAGNLIELNQPVS